MVMRPWLRPLFLPRRARRRSRPWPIGQVLKLEPLEIRAMPSFIAPLSFDAGTNPTSVVVGDFNGNGIPDLVATASDGRGGGIVSVLLGNGDGSFQATRTFAAGSNPTSVVVGDFNGDGIPDLAVANSGSNDVSVLLGNGDGTFKAKQDYTSGNSPTSVAVGDFNGDGWADLAVANGIGVSILLKDTSWPTGPGRTGGGRSPVIRPGSRATPAALLASGQHLSIVAPGIVLPQPGPTPSSRPTTILDAFWTLPPRGKQVLLEQHPAALHPVRPATAGWSDDLLLAALAADERSLPE